MIEIGPNLTEALKVLLVAVCFAFYYFTSRD